MSTDPMRDPAPDPWLREQLAGLDPPPTAEVDFGRLHGSIRDRAALPLARRRRARRAGTRWLRPALPAAVAAGIALVVATQVFQQPAEPGNGGAGEARAGIHPVVEEVLGMPISELELDLLFGQANADLLVVAAVNDR